MSERRTGTTGLDVLLEMSGLAAVPAVPEVSVPSAAVVEMAVEDLHPGRYQPRQRLSEENLAELADTIRDHGVLQPLVVRRVVRIGAEQTAPVHEIVAGERRWRAARMAGLSTVPVVVRELDDQSALAVALIENLQREDLNPIDQALSLSRLVQEFGLTHEQTARAVGRSRSSVSNLVRLLDLQDEVKALVEQGRIDMGHARALLSLDAERQVVMARKAEARGLSVRQVERAVKNLLRAPADAPAERPAVDLQTLWLQHQLERELGQKLAIRPAADGGYTLQIGFADLGQLQGVLHRIQVLIGQVREAAGPRARNPDTDLSENP